jgi:hypothetical protein
MTNLDSTVGRDHADLNVLVDDAGGRISRRIYADPEIHALEQERIFRRAWGFLAHESEVPNPGDYIERALAGEPVIIIRGNDGKVRALLNSCRHRGMRVVRADRGNASFLRSPITAGPIRAKASWCRHSPKSCTNRSTSRKKRLA